MHAHILRANIYMRSIKLDFNIILQGSQNGPFSL